MEQSPSGKASRFSASQEIPRILWNPKVHYCSHKCLPPARILRQLDAVQPPEDNHKKGNATKCFNFDSTEREPLSA